MSKPDSSRWTFLTNHAVVLLCIADDPGIRLRAIADRVGLTERAVQRIIGELIEEGFLTKAKAGRRNTYAIDATRHLRHPLADHHEIGKLLEILGSDRGPLAPSATDRTRVQAASRRLRRPRHTGTRSGPDSERHGVVHASRAPVRISPG